MKNHTYINYGLYLVLFSSLLYGFEAYYEFDTSDGNFGLLFFIHYLPSVVYLFVVKYHEEHFWRFFQKENFRSHTLLLVLFNISAYSLNRSIPVFNESADWLMIFLCIENTLLLSYALLNKPSRTFQAILCFFMVIALVFNIYQTIMIMPILPLGILGIPMIGISLLVFVPVFYLICIVTLLKKMDWNMGNKASAASGLIFSLIAMVIFCTQWIMVESTINQTQLVQDAPFVHDQGLPDWISVAQVIDNTPLTEKYLKSGLVYQEFADFTSNGFSSIWRSSFDEKLTHDPLVSVASLFTSKHTIDEDTRIKVLNYLYDARHQSSDRFWSGENLKSKQVVTNVELFPEERLSFTEQIITIENTRVSRSRWRSQQEALYTFDLPEGGVVTALSLWIEGQESKAILTSKKKAQKAYNTIVGREMRDPSVVYWMEGNKVRVRVFPCTPEKNRKFKIGTTAPLLLTGNQLRYRAHGFKGPDQSKAESAVHVVTHDADIIHSTIPLEEEPSYYSWQGHYRRDWHLTIEAPNVPNNSFSHQNEHFAVEETIPQQTSFSPQKVYLDISSSWTAKDLETIAKCTDGMEVYAFTTSLRKRNSIYSITRMMDTKLPTFTLFPFHQIDSDQSVIITKGGKSTPNLSDLKGAHFREDLFAHFKDQARAPLVIDIGDRLTDYMKSLKEFGVIAHHQMTPNEVARRMKTDIWPQENQEPNLTIIPQNGLSIRKIDQSIGNNESTDHLMRLFYYQQVLHDIGQKYFTDDSSEYLEGQIVEKATTAHIVTPLSSLIVLETQHDYDRFDIKKKTDSLGNASISNSGAVPEPHEWALIILGIGFIFYIQSKKRWVRS